jgi:NTP pyrophosphatase (non-canonical NTP hydrolase)
MSDIKRLTEKILEFRDARDWKQFHNQKDMALSLCLEAAEVLEHFQWKNLEEAEAHIKTNKEELGDELADVFYWVLLMAHDADIDIIKAFEKKMLKNAQKFPIDKAAGAHSKYSDL